MLKTRILSTVILRLELFIDGIARMTQTGNWERYGDDIVFVNLYRHGLANLKHGCDPSIPASLVYLLKVQDVS